jgi:hypothetical protein
VANQVPLIGHQLAGNIHTLRRSSIFGLVAGIIALIWGTSGLAHPGLSRWPKVWNLPGPERPGYVQRLGRAAQFLGVLGLGVIITTLPGAGAAWTAMQALGTYPVRHFLHTDSVYGVFATVLGLLAWIYLGAEIAVYAAETNVVLARRLWPRSIVQPPLTEADRAVLADHILQNQRRDDQHIAVSFDDPPPGTAASSTPPQTPTEIVSPAQSQSGGGTESAP